MPRARRTPAAAPAPPGARPPASGAQVLVGEPAREVRTRTERLAVGTGQHTGVEHPARVTHPALQLLRADPARLVTQVGRAEHLLAALHQLGLRERARV